MILYRGINRAMFEKIKIDNLIEPRSYEFEIKFKFDDSIKYDGSAQYGASRNNAILGHQIDSHKYKTSGISTTPNFEIARKYALNKNESGVILELETEDLNIDEYEIIIVADTVVYPNKSEDEERIFKHKNDKPIPLNIFTRIHDV